MSPRIERHGYLVNVLEQQAFSSQTDVVKAMKRGGFEVTQSSISRDFRELGVVKLAGRYVLPARLNVANEREAPEGLLEQINIAGPNMVVLKTREGAASLVAAAIDEQSYSGVVGTIAGDDTIFVAMEDKRAQSNFIRVLTTEGGWQ